MRQELERLLDTHRAQRPEMQPQDYYKLLYQREFGCGHTAPAPETAGRHLMEEYARAAGLPGAVQVAPDVWHLVAGLSADQHATTMRRILASVPAAQAAGTGSTADAVRHEVGAGV